MNPQEIVVRRATFRDVDGVAHVHVESWHDAYRGILPDDLIASRTVEKRRTAWGTVLQQDRATVFVAANPQKVIGFASAIVLDPPVDGFTAYLQTLYLLPEAKRKGIGTTLLRSIAAALKEQGCRNLALRVLRENPARRFYETLGARLVPGGISTESGCFDDVVYAFDDIAELANSMSDSRRRGGTV